MRETGVLQKSVSTDICCTRGIFTYGGRGLSKDGIDLANHAVLYNENGQPCVEDNEPDLKREYLAVRVRSPQDKLDSMSRINFGKIHTIEHNIPVKSIGMIANKSMPAFNQYVHEALASIDNYQHSPYSA